MTDNFVGKSAILEVHSDENHETSLDLHRKGIYVV